MAKRRNRLTPLQGRFVDEYIVDLNATQAAIRAGVKPSNAASQAHKWLIKDHVSQAIAKAQEARSKRTQITQDAVLKRVAQMAFTDLDAFVSWTKDKLQLRESATIPREHIAALQEIAETREGLRVKLVDRMPALTLLFRHLRLLPLPGSYEDPLHLEATIKEEELDLSTLSDDELRAIQDVIGALLTAQKITSGDSQ